MCITASQQVRIVRWNVSHHLILRCGLSTYEWFQVSHRNERSKLNISCYKQVRSPNFFLGIISTSTPNGDIEIEAFLAEVPENGVIEMQHGAHGCPERQTVTGEAIRSDKKNSQISYWKQLM